MSSSKNEQNNKKSQFNNQQTNNVEQKLLQNHSNQVNQQSKQNNNKKQISQSINPIKNQNQTVVTQQNQKSQKVFTEQIKTTNKISINQLTPAKLQLKSELLSMQFQPYLIDQAIQVTDNLDQAIEYIISKLQFSQQQNQKSNSSNQVKVFFIVRMDLKMGTGKIAAQVGHASLRAFQNMRYSSSNSDKSANLLIEWMQNGQKNKILQAQTQYELNDYLDRAGGKFINNCYIRDAGRTQIAAGSMTVAAIGPVRECDVDFLKHLKEL